MTLLIFKLRNLIGVCIANLLFLIYLNLTIYFVEKFILSKNSHLLM